MHFIIDVSKGLYIKPVTQRLLPPLLLLSALYFGPCTSVLLFYLAVNCIKCECWHVTALLLSDQCAGHWNGVIMQSGFITDDELLLCPFFCSMSLISFFLIYIIFLILSHYPSFFCPACCLSPFCCRHWLLLSWPFRAINQLYVVCPRRSFWMKRLFIVIQLSCLSQVCWSRS